MDIEVLEPTASAMYLGRELSLMDTHTVELKHRIKKAWAKFGTFKDELTNKSVPLYLRIKLFNTIMPPTVLYGCGSWVMTGTRERLLRSTQMKMMRAILGSRRVVNYHTCDVETWVEWVQRAKREARQCMASIV